MLAPDSDTTAEGEDDGSIAVFDFAPPKIAAVPLPW